MINIIYSNTTKSQINDIKHLLSQKEGLDVSDVLLCEDRFTLSLEQEILDSKANSGSFSLNIFSFSRLLYQLLKNEPPKKYLTTTGSVMMVAKALYSLSNELLCYNGLAKNYSSFSKSLFNVISQLKSSKITPDEMKNATPVSATLAHKTHDIAKIYSEYENIKENTFLDAADKIDLLYELIPNSNFIKSSDVTILGFTSFTKQFYEVIGQIFLTAKNVNIYVLDGDNEVYDNTVAGKLICLCKMLNLNYKIKHKNEVLSLTKRSLSQNLFSYRSKENIPKVESNQIEIFEANNLSNELKIIAERIIFEVRYNKRRFRDIAIIGANLEDNHELIARELSKYDIPIFLDNKSILSEHILVKVLISILKINSLGYIDEDVLTIIDSPFFELDFEKKLEFENYLLKNNITKNNFEKNILFKDSDMKSIRNDFIKRFSFPMKQISKISNYCQYANDIIDKLSLNLDNLYDNYIKVNEIESAEITLQAVEKLKETLAELNNILGDEIVSSEEFIQILLDGLNAKQVSIIPLYTDSVFVGDFSSSKFREIPILFAMSMNNTLVPMQKSDVGLITDKDIDGLSEPSLKIEPKIESVNNREKLNVYLALLNYSEKLILSYSNYSMALDKLTPSEVIQTITSSITNGGNLICPKRITREDISTDEKLQDYCARSVLTKKIAIHELAHSVSEIKIGNNSKEKLLGSIYLAMNKEDKPIIDKIIQKQQLEFLPNAFSSRKLFSVSTLEKYFDCPYKNFISGAIKAKDRELGYVRAIDVGIYIHGALENFMSNIDKINLNNYKEFAEKSTMIMRQRSPFDLLNKIPRHKAMIDRLDHEFNLVAKSLTEQYENSNFNTIGQEIRFGNSSFDSYPSLKIAKDTYLRGSIDYADQCGDYVRVIDYKTGHIDSAISSIFLGHKIQPYIYLSVLMQNKNAKPSGALYIPINSNYSDIDDNKGSVTKGYLLADKNVLNDMDTNFSKNNSSTILNVKCNKNSDTFNRYSKVLSESEFIKFVDYAKFISLKAINEIKMGNITPSPYDNSCEYCQYKGICNYDKKLCGVRKYKGQITENTILSSLEKEDNNE